MKIREEFVLKVLEPDSCMKDLCSEYGISRKTGYKWLKRFQEQGIEGLRDMSRRPRSSPLRASGESVLQVLELRGRHPRWGPKKLHRILQRMNGDGSTPVPSIRTIARILDRAGKIRSRTSRSVTLSPKEAPAPRIDGPNDLWTVDLKGWWLCGDGTQCEPLTVRDAFSRWILCAQLMPDRRAESMRECFERLFEAHGVPTAILVDNGSPFACTESRGGLTTLSAWWISLGIEFLRCRLGHPEDNGAHERMHRDMLHDLQENPAATFEQQQQEMDVWRHEFNHVRPHEALDQLVPADVYRHSTRPYRGSKPWVYPAGYVVRKVGTSGLIKYHGNSIRISQALRGYHIGLKPLTENTFEIHFYELCLGELELSH